MHLKGGFLDESTFHLSRNLSTVIGGRGAGKSTALRSLAYALGSDEEFGEQDNCPTHATVYCRATNRATYRIERTRHQTASYYLLSDDGDEEIDSLPFRIEYYRQNSLADVAKDPEGEPQLLQGFLDKHLNLDALNDEEQNLLSELEVNSAQMRPFEAELARLPSVSRKLAETTQKLQLAERGKIPEIADLQNRLLATKGVLDDLDENADSLEQGVSLEAWTDGFEPILEVAVALDEGEESNSSKFIENTEVANRVAAARRLLEELTEFIGQQESTLSERFERDAGKLRRIKAELEALIGPVEEDLNSRIKALSDLGLKAEVAELTRLAKQKQRHIRQKQELSKKQKEFEELLRHRQQRLRKLQATRQSIAERRESQAKALMPVLDRIVSDYKTVVRYDQSGIVDEFVEAVGNAMQGTNFRKETAHSLCEQLSPQELVEIVGSQDSERLAELIGGGARKDWAPHLLERLGQLSNLHKLEVVSKPAKPVIEVVSRDNQDPKTLTLGQLSDGQRHTVLLTIAMFNEAYEPLVIDQPEDELDNEFVFRSVVTTLRQIKGGRQIVVVTHNANIAVLGDSELIVPLARDGDVGAVLSESCGSIDSPKTKSKVKSVLEGGEDAFERRKAIYGH